MSVSGTTSFTLTRDQIIQYALRKLAVLELGATPESNMIANAAQSLDMLVKSWVAKGSKLWTIQELTLPLTANKTSYIIGTGFLDISYGGNTYRVQGNNVATSIVPSIGTGGTDGTYSATIGGAINGLPTCSYTITDGGITSITFNYGVGYVTAPTVTFADGGLVGTITTSVSLVDLNTDKPMTLMQAWIRNITLTPQNDIPMQVISQHDYNILGSKGATGTPNSMNLAVGRDQSVLKIYVTPDVYAQGTYQAHLLVKRTLQDVGTTESTLDFPQEWLYALGWNLAAELASDYELPPNRVQYIEAKAAKALDEIEAFDTEQNSIFFSPGPRFK